MKIAFVWFYDKASQILPNWRDGLRSAVELIGKDHEVEWFLDKEIPDPNQKWDIILFWDDSNSKFFDVIDQYKTAKKGIFLTTNPLNMPNLRMLDAVFCESKPILKDTLAGGAKGILAFGTDTNFFSPDFTVVKDIEYFYPATFSPWKKQSDIAYLGEKLLCVGTIQPDGYAELEACEKNNVQRVVGYIPVEKIRDYYRRSKKVIIPAIHGSERTCLEAMSMNILPIVNQNNTKTASFVKEFIDNQDQYGSPREFVIKKYSHIKYAENVLKGLNDKI